MKSIFIILLFLIGAVACSTKEKVISVKSPDKSIELSMFDINGKIKYSLYRDNKLLIDTSEISILSDTPVKILDAQYRTKDTMWSPVWGQFSNIRDNYKQLELNIVCNKVKGKLLARVYDSGVAFRFVLNEGEKPKKATFLCSYKLPEGSNYFAPNGESEPLGSLSLAALNNYQLGGKAEDRKKNINVPLVVETPNHTFVALLESDLFMANGFKNMKLSVDIDNNKIISNNAAPLTNEGLMSPWRVILLGKTAGDLVVNTVTQNLATPCKIENTDWIKPGKTLWDWRVHGYTTPDGFKYGINTESYLRFIDFAAEKGIDYFLIDDAWYTKVTKGHFEMSDKLDLQKVIDYAKSKKVELLLYYDNRQGVYGDDELFPYYQSLGMKGIKYGFMGPNVPFTKEAIKKSAESKLLIDFHDSPVPMTGVHRTYPNAISREYCHGQQDSRRAFTPEAFIKMALINAITGPLDMNNGNFDITGINSGKREKGPKKSNSYFTTVTSEAARTLIIFSGLVCIPDAPEAYAAKADLFEFIQKLPVGKWDESRILNSKMGDYITTARRHGKEWFIGSVYNQQGGTLDINLDFLDANQKYDVTYYEDTKDTNCKTNPEAYQVRKGVVQRGDVIKAVLAPGGGHCMWIRPI